MDFYLVGPSRSPLTTDTCALTFSLLPHRHSRRRLPLPPHSTRHASAACVPPVLRTQAGVPQARPTRLQLPRPCDLRRGALRLCARRAGHLAIQARFNTLVSLQRRFNDALISMDKTITRQVNIVGQSISGRFVQNKFPRGHAFGPQ